ncbi:hypothetical protein LRAMOSA00319 [Lichtheimia ramosa]|uniref:Uncharacterized protein n=1 Tax=Lichtheimia ramosa TaxID=688394 RepID=A0A077W660_9FUNG|nr:hypothetical protein LRAMOSA00319 [Lichtheimia ramosa]
MLRMYSVLQLQQVWSNKPEEQDLTPATSPIHDVLPAVQEEETEDDNGVAVTTEPNESAIGKEEDQKKNNVTHDGEETLVSGKADITTTNQQVNEHESSQYNSKRDSKMSAGSSSVTDSSSKLASQPLSIVTRTTSTGEQDTSLSTTPVSPKASRSSQIQNKLASQRRSFSRRIKRTFSTSSSNKG